MRNKPLVSIVTVVFNGENFLEETIKSVINQTYENIEYIIIDGASTDGTVEIIKKYEDKINYWVSEKDAGIYDAMNKGIGTFKGDYINFLNAGDSYVNNEVLNNIFSVSKDEDLIYGSISLHDANSNFLINVHPKKFTKFNLMFWGTGTLCHQAMFVSKKILVKYSLKYILKGELNWYFDLEKKIKNISIVDFPVVNYMLGGTGDINYKLNRMETIKVMFKQNGIFGLLSIPFIVYGAIRKRFKNE